MTEVAGKGNGVVFMEEVSSGEPDAQAEQAEQAEKAEPAEEEEEAMNRD